MVALNTLGNFNANDEPEVGFDPIPAGEYKAAATKSEMKDTKSGTGKYLQVEIEVIDGQYKSRKLWARFNLINPNADAVRIARGEFAALCRAVKVPQPKDSAELHNKPFLCRVGLAKDGKGNPTNEIKGYHPLNGQAATQTESPAESSGKPSWA